MNFQLELEFFRDLSGKLKIEPSIPKGTTLTKFPITMSSSFKGEEGATSSFLETSAILSLSFFLSLFALLAEVVVSNCLIISSASSLADIRISRLLTLL